MGHVESHITTLIDFAEQGSKMLRSVSLPCNGMDILCCIMQSENEIY
jgi:hypothetical protein